jgi:hypothetical protein
MEWRQDSILQYWLGGDLAREEVNLAYYTRGAIDQNWDKVGAANQPLFAETTSIDAAESVIRMDYLATNMFGVTASTPGTVWQPCDANRCYAWRGYYRHADVYYNYNVEWNNTGTYQKLSTTFWTIDIRCVALHEHGHAEGLGHSTSTGAVMYFDCSQSKLESLQADDTDGLRAIYRAGL